MGVTRLSARLDRLESGGGGAHYVPPPEAFVFYAGPRDPVAIMRALGLDPMERLMVQVLAEGCGPNDPPRLADEVKLGGRAGMTNAQRKFAEDAGRGYPSGRAWGFYWASGGKGWTLDQGETPFDEHGERQWFREFDCGESVG